MTLMAVRKISVSIDEQILELAREAAEEDGVSLSAWLTELAGREARRHAGLRAVAEFEAENGPFTEEELRRAGEVLDRLGIRDR